VVEDAAGRRVGDRFEDGEAALREAREVRAVVDRRAEAPVGRPLVPELAVVDAVERQVQRGDAGRRRRRRALVLVAQVDQRADAGRVERRPVVLVEMVERAGAEQRPFPDRAAVARPDPAEIAPVVHRERYTGCVLRVIAAAVLGSRGLLLVSKRAAPDVFYLPGGKPERGEAALDCLGRERSSGWGSWPPNRSPRCGLRPRSRVSRCG
jgi:hypothetical protein